MAVVTTIKPGRPRGSSFEKIESVRFTLDQHQAFNDAARELGIPRSEVIRKATALGLPLLKAAMRIFQE